MEGAPVDRQKRNAGGERVRWVLDPLVGVGPLRFGMSPTEVGEALGEPAPVVSSGWETYRAGGVTAIFAGGSSLVAVAIDALSGPSVRLGDVELIARAPSEVRSDLLGLARRQGVPTRVGPGGEPQVAAWGVSIGAVHEQEPASGPFGARTGRVVTDALLVGPGLAEDPYGFETVVRWRGTPWGWGGARGQIANSAERPVTSERERARWGCVPLEGVGPLRFGMGPSEVAAALGGAAPTERQGSFPDPWPWLPREAGQWFLHADVFDGVGVTAHYEYRSQVPVLGAVTVHAFTGPQVEFEGIRLIGRPVSEVDGEVDRHVGTRGVGLRVTCAGDQGPYGDNWYVRAVRAGDAMLSEVRFCAAEWWEE
ncbi:hypothetical protein AB0O91_08255 [Kitasatospora sp. NPDC089797]|uniref:hypothetical protein n=1 Tax=Kitasatospora sp. NPDC089797 TaxID=3155298 RepID=UPI003425B8A5